MSRDRDVEGDVALARAAAAGETRAREALVARLFDSVHRVAACLAGPCAEADDIAQAALVEVLRSAGSFRGESPLEHWADRIAVRTATRRLRKAARRRDLFARYPELARPESGIDVELDRRRVADRLAAILQRLDPVQRVAVVLHHVQGHAVAEIAEITGAPFDTVKYRLGAARARLRALVLEDEMLAEWLGRERGEEP